MAYANGNSDSPLSILRNQSDIQERREMGKRKSISKSVHFEVFKRTGIETFIEEQEEQSRERDL